MHGQITDVPGTRVGQAHDEEGMTGCTGDVAEGNVGAGCGASVGKIGGFERAMKGGIGTASIKLSNGLVVGAIVVVNALGEIRDSDTRELLAGPLSDEGELQDGASLHWLKEKPFSFTGTNTTLAIVATNAGLTKTELKKVAEMTHDGFARAIYPVHTMYDGDIAFAASTGSIEATVDLVGTLAADVVAEAIARGVRTAVRAGGLLAYRDLACGDVNPAVHKNKQNETETYYGEATLQ